MLGNMKTRVWVLAWVLSLVPTIVLARKVEPICRAGLGGGLEAALREPSVIFTGNDKWDRLLAELERRGWDDSRRAWFAALFEDMVLQDDEVQIDSEGALIVAPNRHFGSTCRIPEHEGLDEAMLAHARSLSWGRKWDFLGALSSGMPSSGPLLSYRKAESTGAVNPRKIASTFAFRRELRFDNALRDTLLLPNRPRYLHFLLTLRNVGSNTGSRMRPGASGDWMGFAAQEFLNAIQQRSGWVMTGDVISAENRTIVLSIYLARPILVRVFDSFLRDEDDTP